jgi:hypothetical protein
MPALPGSSVLRLSHVDVFLQPSDHAEPVVPRLRQGSPDVGQEHRLQRHWREYVGRLADLGAGKAVRSDTNDRERRAVEDNGRADRARLPAKPALPEAMAEHRDGAPGSARSRDLVVGRADRRADRGLDAEHREIAARDQRARDALGRSAGGEAPGRGAKRQQTVERGGAILKMAEQRIRHAELVAAEHDQPLRVGYRQAAQHECVQEAENGRVRADAQRERGHDRQGEGRPREQRAQRELEILNQSVHGRSPLGGAAGRPEVHGVSHRDRDRVTPVSVTSGGTVGRRHQLLQQVSPDRVAVRAGRQRAPEEPVEEARGRDHDGPLRMPSSPRHIRRSTRCDVRSADTPRGSTT